MHMSDEELVILCREGNEAAFHELYDRYEKRMYDLAFRLSHNDADAKDAVQDTFLTVYNSIASLREPKYFSLWIRKILLSKIKQIFAKNKTMTIPDDDHRMVNFKEYKSDFLPVSYSHHQTDQLQLQDFIDHLPMHYRDVLMLSYFGHFKHQDIARLLQIPVGTVKSRLNMARKILKSEIQAYEKQNQIKLDFKEDVLVGGLGMGYACYWKHGGKAGKEIIAHLMRGSWQSVLHTVVCTSLIMTGTLAVGGILYEVNSQQDQPLQHDTRPSSQAIASEVNFTPVSIYDITYETPYQAYIGLKEYLHCSYEMKQLSDEEMKQMSKLYHALKEENGTYYNLLKKQGWNESFEELSNH